MNFTEEISERINYTCNKYYDKGATSQDIISALSAQFFNILLECCEEGEEEIVLNEYMSVLTDMKNQILKGRLPLDHE